MVLRLVGLVGLTLLPLFATAGEVGVHQALANWIRDGGARGVTYRPVGGMAAPDRLPRWLLAPAGADAVNAWFLDRSTYPEAANQDWDRKRGAVWVFGRAAGRGGPRLVVDQDRHRPLALETPGGVRWEFSDYRAHRGRSAGIPGRITRIGPEGEETVLTPR